MKQALTALAAGLAAILLLALLAWAAGHSPLELLTTMLRGSLGSSFAIRATIVKAIPLLLTGIAVAIAFRAGVWNIGAEGQFIVGAIGALLASRWGLVPALIAAMVAGAAWASIATLLRLWRGAPEVLTTILLNFLALHLLGWCVNGPLREKAAMYPQSDPAAVALPKIAGLHAGFVIALAAALTAWWLLRRTAEGLRLRATGFNPSAATWAGINVRAQITRAMLYSGAAAGLAGAVELLGVSGRLFERFASGYGYSGIAVALLARLDPLASIASSLFVGALVSGSGELQRSANISSAVAVLVQALLILILVLFGQMRQKERTS